MMTGRVLFLLPLLFGARVAAAALGPGIAGSPLLAHPAGVRPLALGSAYTAISDDSLAVLWNPAGLPELRAPEVGLTFQRDPGDIVYGYLVYGLPLSRGQGIGVALGSLQSGDVEFNDLTGSAKSVAGQSDWLVAVSYGASLVPFLSASRDSTSPGLNGGISIRLMRTSIGDEYSDRVVVFGAGLMGRVPVIGGLEPATLGLLLQNVGGRVALGRASDPVAQPLRIGFSQRMITVKESVITVTGEAARLATSGTLEGHAGAELARALPNSMAIALRLGLQFGTDLPGPTGGAGFKWNRFALDYAVAGISDLGVAHRAGLTVCF